MEVKRREDLLRIKEEYLDRQKSYKRQVLVCGGAGCISSNGMHWLRQWKTSGCPMKCRSW